MVKKAQTELTAVLGMSLNHLDYYALKINGDDENIHFVKRLSRKVLSIWRGKKPQNHKPNKPKAAVLGVRFLPKHYYWAHGKSY